MRGLNAETGNISMATMGSSTCHCSIFNHCFSRVKCNLLLLCLTGSAVIAILIIAVFIQRATQIPLRGCPHMCDCFLDSSISPLTWIRRVKPGAERNDDVEIGYPQLWSMRQHMPGRNGKEKG
ncbi:conserved Plasmodium protein, unknown function [Plasmodium ovale curtisi]|uniref:Uncharacterized protein n=1 Tax=Plasmodium ovale curtisi TaxID=864141 RepID=A0A1A8W4S0_PLAOA|nr:conserved Plasmodium protein, unknown function [Plasmodium ovale curtisi]SBT02156.1 conserved Plasmodium protein, unknown function [Plasmodium ovale curtisi]